MTKTGVVAGLAIALLTSGVRAAEPPGASLELPVKVCRYLADQQVGCSSQTLRLIADLPPPTGRCGRTVLFPNQSPIVTEM